MELSTLLEQLSKILGLDSGELSLQSNLEEKGWDSLSQLELIARADAMGLSIGAQELSLARTVEDLFNLVK
jgi:acyl carrier protein